MTEPLRLDFGHEERYAAAYYARPVHEGWRSVLWTRWEVIAAFETDHFAVTPPLWSKRHARELAASFTAHTRMAADHGYRAGRITQLRAAAAGAGAVANDRRDAPPSPAPADAPTGAPAPATTPTSGDPTGASGA